MARTKKNAMELVLGAVEKIEVEKVVVENVAVVEEVKVEMVKKEVILCTMCGEEMESRMFVAQDDYVCEKCFVEFGQEIELEEEEEVEVMVAKKEMLDVTNIFVAVECSYCPDLKDCDKCELPEVEVKETTFVQELAEDMGNSLEDVDALREAMCDEFYENITSPEVDVRESLRLDEEFNQEYINTLNMVQELNTGIRNAIKQGKFVQKGDSMCITGKELLAITKSYKLVTGVDMNNEQILTLKKLNGTQAKYVSYTINYKLREIRNKEREIRFATV